MTLRFFAAPERYIQGAGALGQLATVLAAHGKRPFVVADAATSPEARDGVEAQLCAAMESVVVGVCANGPTLAELERLVATARALDADTAVGFGGATAIALAKGVRMALGLPLVTVPTVPACHAPVSRMIELTGERGEPGEERAMASHPEVVLVDTADSGRAAAPLHRRHRRCDRA
jgi:glycerol dehydrogenase